jgi:hypothetical protein
MRSKFENHKCGECGSEDLAHFVEWYSGQIPAGIEGEIICRGCSYWEKVLTVVDTSDIFDTPNWVVLEAGRGKYNNPMEQAGTTTYRDPEAENYARFGIE